MPNFMGSFGNYFEAEGFSYKKNHHIFALHTKTKKPINSLVYTFNALIIFYNALLPIVHLQRQLRKITILD